MMEFAAIGIIVLGALVLVLTVIPYCDGWFGSGGAHVTWSKVGGVPWYLYKLGDKHERNRAIKADKRLREWQEWKL